MQPARVAAVACLALALAAVPSQAADPFTPPTLQQLQHNVEKAVADVQEDPAGPATDPQGTVERLLDPGAGEEENPGAPVETRDPSFADRIRDAVQDDLIVAGLATLLASALGVLGFGLVTRYVSPKEALKNPQRAMLYGFVRGNPGVHLKKLSEEFAMKTSSILWHIRKLECAELVRSERANGFRVFYPVDGGIEIKRVSRAITALQNGNARGLYEAVERSPGLSPAQLGQRLHMHAGTVRWHLRKLRDFGLVEELLRDDGSLVYPTPLGKRTLQTLLGTPTAPSPIPVAALVPVAAE